MGLEAGYSGLREYQDQGQESGKHKVKLREGKDSRMLWKGVLGSGETVLGNPWIFEIFALEFSLWNLGSVAPGLMSLPAGHEAESNSRPV